VATQLVSYPECSSSGYTTGELSSVLICTKLVSLRRIVSSGLLRRVALVRTDVSEEPGASFIRVTKSVN
jgi:hypothetical protein